MVVMVMLVFIVVFFVFVVTLLALSSVLLAPLALIAVVVRTPVRWVVVPEPCPVKDGPELVPEMVSAVTVAVESKVSKGMVYSKGSLRRSALRRQGAVGGFHGCARSVAANQVIRIRGFEEGELRECSVTLTATSLDLELFRALAFKDLGARVNFLVATAHVTLSVSDWLALSVLPLAVKGRIVCVGVACHLCYKLAAESVSATAQLVRDVAHVSWTIVRRPEEVGRADLDGDGHHEDGQD